MNDVVRELEDKQFLQRLLDEDPSLWSDDPEIQSKIRNRLGWLELPQRMSARVAELRSFAEDVADSFDHAVVLGMGGSSLAPEVFQRTIGPEGGFPHLTVLDTTDPATILATERSVNLQRTLFIVSSKSGTTIETLSLFRYFAERVRQERDDGVLDNFVAITDPGTALETQARHEGFRRIFEGEPDVGGRFSALSVFGLVPAAVIGADIGRLLDKATALNIKTGLELGAALAALARAGRDKVTFLAPPALESFADWAEQLLAESTGKNGAGLIPVVGEPAGPPDAYGDDRLFVRLTFEGEDDGLDRPVRALQAAGYPVITVSLPEWYDLAAEFLRWEIATAAAGHAMGINPFDEPNVQESKDNTTDVLQETARAGHLPEPRPAGEEAGLALYASPELTSSLGESGDGLLTSFFREQAGEPGGYFAITAFIQRTERSDALLRDLRTAVRDATGTATTLGYGPRYLHSTGQLHKGGPPKGVFLQITADDPEDIHIPGEPAYGFSVLKRAQALGDFQALQSRGRPIIRVHLGSDIEGGLARLAETVSAAVAQAARTARG